jgi:hypothetical protein
MVGALAGLMVDFSRKYGQWTPLRETRLPFPPSFGANRTVGPRGVRCRCDCGRERDVLLAQLVRGLSEKCKSCANGDRGRDHGLSPNPLFRTWLSMMRRCGDPRDAGYRNYGGRGIRVCERWHDPRLFVEDIERWLGARPAGLTLDRICNDHDYRLDNVRWATRSVQNRNKRRRAVTP